MDSSSVFVKQEPSETLNQSIDDGLNTFKISNGCSDLDKTDGSASASPPGSKRKFESSEGENERDSSVSQKISTVAIPLHVAPLRFVKLPPSQLVSVEVEDSTVPDAEALPLTVYRAENLVDKSEVTPVIHRCRQFWKAGEYEGNNADYDPTWSSVGMDHVRVHPKFLHSNATSHKWALGAFAELLDNSLDEVCNGATYVHVDMLENVKDGSKMLLVEDNGGGMDPHEMRQCMSLGYSSKRNMPNTIGQYGNGFKTSTMRLGADVIVFSRSKGNDQRCTTQSMGLLSYTFLRSTGKEDIVVPMVDFEFKEDCWKKLIRSEDDWNRNLETIAQWSPFASKEDLLNQFNFMNDHGTRIIIYNLWEDEEGNLELDFDTDPHDIQIRGVNRDEKSIKMAQQYPNSRHFLTYRHSLRIYASILYLRMPEGFRVILRGKEVEHHSIEKDLMLTKEVTYKPKPSEKTVPKEGKPIVVTVKIGFVKDAGSHKDVQGFNVYHKNRLIKPFWRIWNPAGSDGRGVIGVLEVNFIEPAHDKQGFERTSLLQKLEARLIHMQKQYWSTNCQLVGYAPRRRSACVTTPSNINPTASTSSSLRPAAMNTISPPRNAESTPSTSRSHPQILVTPPTTYSKDQKVCTANDDAASLLKLATEEKRNQLESILKKESRSGTVVNYPSNYERSKNKSLENQLNEANKKLEEKEKEHMIIVNKMSEEISKKDEEQEQLRKNLSEAVSNINKLLLRIKQLENCITTTLPILKTEPGEEPQINKAAESLFYL